MEIAKVQRPITSSMNIADPPWLIYAKGRKHSEQRPAKAKPRNRKVDSGNANTTIDRHCEERSDEAAQKPRDAAPGWLGADPKAYFEADWSPSAGWSLGKRAKERPW